ncbi:MAG: HNH endonuclease [Promethearchaeota archaeon]|jgi:hypothetical protein
MGLEYKDKPRDSVKDKKSDLEKESEEKYGKGTSILDCRSDSKDFEAEKIEKSLELDLKDFNSKNNDNSITQDTSEEKTETKWDKIDWSKDKLVEKEETKWDKIDWSKDNLDEKEETKWDKIDWSKDKLDEKEETKWDKIDWSKNKLDEKEETKWDEIDWSKDNFDEKKETKWDKIDWSKDNLDEKEETKWERIEWSKDYSAEEKKNVGYKNDNIDDIIMTSGDYNEKIKDINLNEKESADNNNDLNLSKDFDEYIRNDMYHTKMCEGINDILEDKVKDYEEIYDILSDDKENFLEIIEDKSHDNDFDKDFIERIDDDIKNKKQDRDFIEAVEDELKQSEAKDISLQPQNGCRIDDIDQKYYKKQLNEELNENFKGNHEYDLKKREEDLNKIKEYLKQANWSDISEDWKIQVYVGRGYKEITLNPYQDCSKSNPLYKHENWLKWVYTNKELNLNDISIAKICGNISNKTIGNWRERFGIPRKEIGNYIKNGYRFLYMPKDYKHPEFNPTGDKRIYRPEHIVVMENHLNKVLKSEELSRHPCLIKNDDNYYILNGSIVHHINHNRKDNRIENLWLYKNKSEHNNSNINECLRDLIKLNQVSFSEGNYYVNYDYNYRKLNLEKKNEILKQKTLNNYEDLDKVRNAIKNMDWSGMDWNIEYKIRNNAPIEKIQLNPKEDCSKKNPLYRHKGWIERIVRDKRFNLTDRRLGELCGISERTARRYRKEKHEIPAIYRGIDRYIGGNSLGKKIIYVKLDKSYGNPFAIEKANSIQMREHRYIMEKHLAQEPELNKDYLVNGKYLKSECNVHHINLDKLDNRLENLYPCKNASDHNTVHLSLIKLIDEMMKSSLIVFDNGKYLLDN